MMLLVMALRVSVKEFSHDRAVVRGWALWLRTLLATIGLITAVYLVEMSFLALDHI